MSAGRRRTSFSPRTSTKRRCPSPSPIPLKRTACCCLTRPAFPAAAIWATLSRMASGCRRALPLQSCTPTPIRQCCASSLPSSPARLICCSAPRIPQPPSWTVCSRSAPVRCTICWMRWTPTATAMWTAAPMLTCWRRTSCGSPPAIPPALQIRSRCLPSRHRLCRRSWATPPRSSPPPPATLSGLPAADG